MHSAISAGLCFVPAVWVSAFGQQCRFALCASTASLEFVPAVQFCAL